jgi:hypothetical protein
VPNTSYKKNIVDAANVKATEGGYECRDSILFPFWNRAYVALIEVSVQA